MLDYILTIFVHHKFFFLNLSLGTQVSQINDHYKSMLKDRGQMWIL